MTRDITGEVFEQFTQRPKVALLMSGLGSNADAVLSDSKIRDLYDFTVLVSDNSESNASKLGRLHKVPVLSSHVDRFANQGDRMIYFDQLHEELLNRGVQAAIYAGFMKIATPEFCVAIPGVNVHPADLSIKDVDGIARYRGMRAMNHMLKDLGYVRSTFHVVDTPVDNGAAISLSDKLYPESYMSDKEVHGMLKTKEHYIFTRTLRLLGESALDRYHTPYSYQEIMGLCNE